ncbi:Similar to Ubiquitin-40S ribosomal protein S27a; acc. no. P14799 [Pyronema omphalodes CBS 100304]|uniref:Similar to Ubiquitin-40S ribosomal protein S27a acc. no. P14799 n=1 Tax=Pyronema omphalodes (strain CBS 100304) TaxID=1076935 RepID=U4LQG2_PYROM|nr:Similar to Ubiquitin-40S ribosomal protein S27a; acc. no. P14799 [Pyronema omphalodes CBS 100304]
MWARLMLQPRSAARVTQGWKSTKPTKLAVLKYYKVDGDGKIERLRRECPQEGCGAGVFMAAMQDRQYCGRCHLTYVFEQN